TRTARPTRAGGPGAERPREAPGTRALAHHPDEVGGHLLQEAGRGVVARSAPEGAAHGVREVQALPGPGDTDIAEAALLLELFGVGQGSGVREDALLEAGDEHDGELEALGVVQRHERGRRLLRIVLVLLAHQGNLREELVERALGEPLPELPRHAS